MARKHFEKVQGKEPRTPDGCEGHMKGFGVKLDDDVYMPNPTNAKTVLTAISRQDGESPSMPPGGPYWTADQVALFVQWQTDGYQP